MSRPVLRKVASGQATAAKRARKRIGKAFSSFAPKKSQGASKAARAPSRSTKVGKAVGAAKRKSASRRKARSGLFKGVASAFKARRR